MRNYVEWPPLPYVNIITERSPDHLYVIDRGVTAVFPIQLQQEDAILINASHTSLYNNQNGTIVAWPSEQVAGQSITIGVTQNPSRVNLLGNGFSWLLYRRGMDPKLFSDAYIKMQIDPNVNYYMCFQNLENKINYFYVKFTSLVGSAAV